jgi:hypothetical protein
MKRNCYNNALFSDSIIRLVDCETHVQQEIHISKIFMLKQSEYFKILINPQVFLYEFHMKQNEILQFINILEYLHNETIVMTTDNMVGLFQIAIRFDFRMFLNNYEKILESNKLTLTIEVLTRIQEYLSTLYQLGAHPNIYEIGRPTVETIIKFTNYKFTAPTIINSMTDKIINNNFKSYYDDIIVSFTTPHINKFAQLHPYSLIKILTNEKFKTDSEDTMLSIIIVWLNNNFVKREMYIPFILPFINFYAIHKHYLISIVPKVINEIKNPDIKNFVEAKYMSALEYHSKMNKQITNQEQSYPTRDVIPSYPEGAFKVEFRKINEWVMNAKYHSQPVLIFGYLFNYFIRPEWSATSECNIVGGYLRCIGPIQGPIHYLPLRIVLSIFNNQRYQKMPPVDIVFDHYDRSIGSRLSMDTWEKIKEGQSGIVFNNTISVIIYITFLNNII